jgi:hypothetical protein
MRPSHTALALALTLAAATSSACTFGALDPEKLSLVRSRAEYVRLAEACLSNYEIWFINGASESLRIDILNVSPELLAAARSRWAADRAFAETLKAWGGDGRGRVVLLGLFSRTFRKDDFLKRGSYRASLILEDGAAVSHDRAVDVPAAFLADYFPAFNHWAKVFALHFPADPGLPASLEVAWPTGDCRVPLARPAAPPPPVAAGGA